MGRVLGLPRLTTEGGFDDSEGDVFRRAIQLGQPVLSRWVARDSVFTLIQRALSVAHTTRQRIGDRAGRVLGLGSVASAEELEAARARLIVLRARLDEIEDHIARRAADRPGRG